MASDVRIFVTFDKEDAEVSKGHKASRGQILFYFLTRAVGMWMCPISDNQMMHL